MKSTTGLWAFVVATVMLVLLAACGGGGGSAGTTPFGSGSGTAASGTTTGTTATTPTVVLTISSTNVSVASPATVTAVVRSSTGALLSGQVVNFTTSNNLGAFSAASALTDINGAATVKLSPAASTSNGADLVVANVTVSTVAVSGVIGFQVTPVSGTALGSPSLTLALSATNVTSAAPVTATAVVKDAGGTPVSGVVVKFTSTDALGAFSPASALTDATGTVSVSLSPASATSNGADYAVATTTVGNAGVTAQLGFVVISPTATTTGSPSIGLTLSSVLVSANVPTTATAVVKNNAGVGIAGQVVQFSTVDGLGTFAVSSALTDATGTASAVLTAVGASKSGADQVLASTTVNGAVLQATQGFQLSAANAQISTLTSDAGTLSAYGQANLTATITGTTAGTAVTVAITSSCVAAGKATLTPASLTTTTGTASFTYRDKGCGATATSDTLQATIVGTVNGKSLSLALTSPTVSSIVYTASTPSLIYLKGSGLTETSTVTFSVVDTAGNGVPNQLVTLQLVTASGGLTLDGGAVAVTKLTDSLGNVTALINSGTVPTPVRVRATLGAITTVSSGLSVAVGLPSELGFSLSQKAINIEGYDIDGTTNTYSVIASDRLGNPVPVGTAINFIAEGGQVEPTKSTVLTTAGIATATANFVSASPRPVDGRVTVLAYALGEESFLDTNGNNVFDPADTQFQDLGAVFLSRKYIDAYFSATDQLIPLSITGVGTGVACVAPTSSLFAFSPAIPTVAGTTCDGAWGRAYVRKATETVLSTSTSRPLFTATGGLYGTCTLALDRSSSAAQNLIAGYNDVTGVEVRAGNLYVMGSGVLYTGSLSGSFAFLLADNNPVRLNPVAAGSTIAATAPTGVTVTVGGTPVPSTAEAPFGSISYIFATTTPGVPTTPNTSITITITSPAGLATTYVQPLSYGSPAGTACN